MKISCYHILVLLWLPSIAFGHHAAASTYNPTESNQIEGVIKRIVWRNPHVRFKIRVASPSGAEELWDVESNSISILSRMGIDADVVKVGDRVRIAGWPARRPIKSMFATNMLLPAGQEVLLSPRATPRWSEETLGMADAWVSEGAAAISADAAGGIFRVWSSNLANPDSFPLFKDVVVVEDNYPLTDAARTARENWDPVADNLGMPRVMGQPYPIEFVDDGDKILLRIELHDIERTIHMDISSIAESVGKSSHGYSVGQWDGDTLVVTTSRVSWPYFDQSGVPLSEAAEIVERFTPDMGRGHLNYSIKVTDPAVFTEPVTLTKHWIWRPGEQLQKFECTESE
jgi:hypothetical protein